VHDWSAGRIILFPRIIEPKESEPSDVAFRRRQVATMLVSGIKPKDDAFFRRLASIGNRQDFLWLFERSGKVDCASHWYRSRSRSFPRHSPAPVHRPGRSTSPAESAFGIRIALPTAGRLVLCLDPDEGLNWHATRAEAFELREDLGELGHDSGALVTVRNGIHVWMPLKRSRRWETLKLFVQTFVHTMEKRFHDRYAASLTKGRRKSRIVIDYLGKERGSTAIAPYSVRARPRPPMAVPVTWPELDKLKVSNSCRLKDMENQLKLLCLAQEFSMQMFAAEVIGQLGKQLERLKSIFNRFIVIKQSG